MSMHLNKVSTTAMAGFDMDIGGGENRDTLEINRNLQTSWPTVVGEPEGIRSPEWVWKITTLCFGESQSCTYKLLTIIFAPLFSMILGIHFAVLAFLQIWIFRPLLRMLYIIFHIIKTFLDLVLGGTLGPLCQVFGLCFSSFKVRHQRVYDAKDEPQFPFII